MSNLRRLLASSLLVAAACGSGGTMNNNSDLSMTAKPDLSGPAGPDLAVQSSCDPLAQNCVDATNSKCTAIDDGMGSVTTGCVKPTGAKMTGDPCTRTGMGAASIGHDDCVKGNYCSGIGNLTNPPTRFCRKFCNVDGDCGAKEKCSSLLKAPSVGICVPTCALFGTDCMNGQTCANLSTDNDGNSVVVTCNMAGSSGANAPCPTGLECSANYACLTPAKGMAPVCTALCDMSHACANGQTCTALGLPNGGGFCK